MGTLPTISYGFMFLLAGLIGSSCEAQNGLEEAHPAQSSSVYLDSLDSAIKALSTRHFGAGLEAPALHAAPAVDVQRLAAEIKKETPIDGVSKGVVGQNYDVILQPGHYGRPPEAGNRGTSGQRVSERALVAYIVGPISQALRAQGLNVLVIPADPKIQGKLSATAFLAVHADGSTHPCSGKPSLGYSAGTSPFAMHAVGWALSQALGANYKDFQHDNFTANESDYYMFRRVDGAALSGILEIGELTCSGTEDKLIADTKEISDNLSRALLFVVGR